MILDNENQIAVDRMTGEAQKAGLGTEVGLLGNYSPCIITFAVTADATLGLAIPIPFAFEILDVIVQCRASNGSGSLLLKKASTAITDAIACVTDKAIARAGTIDDAQATLSTTDVLTVTANGAGDKGLVTIIGKRA